MTITKQEATRLECVLISSILENPTARFGPHICTALAYAPEFWDSVEAAKIAASINELRSLKRPTHPVLVRIHTDPQYMDWVKHPDFQNALPLSSMEPEALLLVERYHNKRIVATIANAYQKLIDKPELAKEVGFELSLKLQGIL